MDDPTTEEENLPDSCRTLLDRVQSYSAELDNLLQIRNLLTSAEAASGLELDVALPDSTSCCRVSAAFSSQAMARVVASSLDSKIGAAAADLEEAVAALAKQLAASLTKSISVPVTSWPSLIE